MKDNLAAYFLDIVRSEAFMKWECHHQKVSEIKKLCGYDHSSQADGADERDSPQLKSLCEAIYAESILNVNFEIKLLISWQLSC